MSSSVQQKKAKLLNDLIDCGTQGSSDAGSGRYQNFLSKKRSYTNRMRPRQKAIINNFLDAVDQRANNVLFPPSQVKFHTVI